MLKCTSKYGLMTCFIVRKYVIFNSLTSYATELSVIVKFPYTKIPLYFFLKKRFYRHWLRYWFNGQFLVIYFMLDDKFTRKCHIWHCCVSVTTYYKIMNLFSVLDSYFYTISVLPSEWVKNVAYFLLFKEIYNNLENLLDFVRDYFEMGEVGCKCAIAGKHC